MGDKNKPHEPGKDPMGPDGSNPTVDKIARDKSDPKPADGPAD